MINTTLNTIAQNYSEYLGTVVLNLLHSDPAKKGLYGENLYWSWGYPGLTYPPGEASNSWYSEQSNYNYDTYPPAAGTGHFTAMIWKSVTSVGFGFYKSVEDGGQAIYVVANYYPTPNVRTALLYQNNVPKPL